MAQEVFISYSHRDDEFVLRLAADLEDRGASVWIDRGNIQGGEQWRRSIATGVQACKAFALVVSPDSIDSQYVAEELALAFQHRKPIVPLLYRKTNIPAMLKAQLDAYQFLDFGKGGYAQNLADLVAALTRHGVALQAAPDEMARRRRERLGAPVKTPWGAVIGRIPGWAFAWGIGWAIFWLVLPIALSILAGSEFKNLAAAPVGGFAGGIAGGLLAGFFTMLALRRNAISIRWKHMSRSIRIWGLYAPIGVIVAGALVMLLFNPDAILGNTPECSQAGLAECLVEGFGYALASGIAAGFMLVLTIIFYALVAVFGLGLIAGWLAVRHIRRLEPGILGRQAIWVVLGWGGGAVLAAIAGAAVMNALGA